MSNKAKAKGTRAETRVVKYLKEKTGIENIHRRELHGAKDIGDIIVENLAIIEVKAGKQTQNYSRTNFDRWLDQTMAEHYNAGTDVGYAYLIIVEYNKPLKDAKVFEWKGDNADRECNFWYLDNFVGYLEYLFYEVEGLGGE